MENQVAALLKEKEQLKIKLDESDNFLEFKTPSGFPLHPVLGTSPIPVEVESPVSNPFQLIRLKSPSSKIGELKRLFQTSEVVTSAAMDVDVPTSSKNVTGTAAQNEQEGVADSETILNIAKAVQQEVAEKEKGSSQQISDGKSGGKNE